MQEINTSNIMTIRSKILSHPAVEEISDERSCGDGLWVYLKDGYIAPMQECGIIHEETWNQCLRELCCVYRKSLADIIGEKEAGRQLKQEWKHPSKAIPSPFVVEADGQLCLPV
jgi:hypothetical protein